MSGTDPTPVPRTVPWSRLGWVALVGVCGTAGVGYVVGVVQPEVAHHASIRELPHSATPADGNLEILPATAYDALDARRFGKNAGFRTMIPQQNSRSANIPVEPTAADPAPPALDLVERARALADRERLRAFQGGPPVIPHPAQEMTSAHCLACHGTGLVLGDLSAAPIPHAIGSQCTQCHVEAESADLRPRTFVGTDFVGLDSPHFGHREWQGAPPQIPHTTRMRENCLACHGATAPLTLRTSHPERSQCLQCHAVSAAEDQRAAPAVDQRP